VYTNHDYSRLVDGDPALSAKTLLESESKGVYLLPDLSDRYVKQAPLRKELKKFSWPRKELRDSTIKYEIDLRSTKNGDYYCVRDGWAVVKGKELRRVLIVLKSGDEKHVFSTHNEYRHDITELMKKTDSADTINYDNCGFSFLIRTDRFRPGQYELGLLIETKDSLNYHVPAKQIILK